MDTEVIISQTLDNSLYAYGYGITAGLLFSAALYMLLLAIFYFKIKNIYACKLFIYNATATFLFIFFDIFSLSVHSPQLSQFIPQTIIEIGSIVVPIALLLNFQITVTAIPIKTVDAFFFWNKYQHFYLLIQAFLVISFFLLLIVSNDKVSFLFSLCLIISLCIIEYILINKLIKSSPYKKAQRLISIGLISCSLFIIFGALTKDFSAESQLFWMINRLILGTLIIIYTFLFSKFIIQENLYIPNSSKINGVDFFKEIYNAVQHNHFYIEYQPKIYLENQEISGAEALIRWQHPKHGFIPPDSFIPLAERTDLINQICQWVIVRVVRDIKDMELLNINLPISINFSVNNLHIAMVNFLISSLKIYNVPADMIIVEITETMFLDMNDQHQTALKMLRDANIKLSMDDFGAGHSSFAYFDEIGLNELKLDRKIVSNVLIPNKSKIVSTIINLCHSLNIKVVAEGIEDKEIQEKLLEMNCNYAQGYGICRPKRFADFTDWVRFEHPESQLARTNGEHQ